ncbi:MAG: hypothetical protein ACI9HK_000318 [Pirellulaceae bacterium]|jgi:hypothetical protein
MSQERVLIISFSYLNRDPRVNRQIRYLKDDYQVICAGAGHPHVDGVEYVELTWNEPSQPEKLRNHQRLMRRHYEDYYWQSPFVVDAAQKLDNVEADLILANDIDSLPFALKIAGDTPVLFDAHEYSPLEFEDLLWFWALHRGYKYYLCRNYIPQATTMTTVCQGIANRYNTDCGVMPEVVMNTPLYEDLKPLVPAADDRIRIIHHGGAMVSRKLELSIEMMRYLDDRFELYFMLMESNPAYMDRLKVLAKKIGRTYFVPPVEMPEIPRASNAYDIGLFLLPPVNFNYKHALPNKLFEYIQSRLAIAIGPSPEMAKIVKQHELGVVAEQFHPRSLAMKLNRLSMDDIMQFKRNSHAVAMEYSSEVTKLQLLKIVRETLGKRVPSTS